MAKEEAMKKDIIIIRSAQNGCKNGRIVACKDK